MALEETVVLDIADGLQQIDALEEALTNAATTFKVALADALDVLTGVQVTDVDSSQITTSIDTAVNAADLSLEPEVDASTVTTAIDDAVNAADTNVEIDALTASITDDINASIADADLTVEVSADTTEAQAAIEELTGATTELSAAAGDPASGGGGAERSLTNLGSAATASGVTIKAMAGETGALSGALGSMGGKVGPVVGVIGALGVATNKLVGEAIDAQLATEQFNRVFGELAEQVDRIEIGGLNDDLSALAVSLGADDDALRLSVAALAELGIASGATRSEVAETAEEVLALALSVSAARPQLGSASDIVDGLTAALGRGGKTLAPYGLALDAAAIKTRAVADAGGDAAAETDIFALRAAGAALAVEQLGSKIKSNIDDGLDNPTIKLRALKQELAEAFEDAGAELIDPFVASLEALTPVLVLAAELLGPILQGALVLLGGALRGVNVILGFTAFGLQELFELAGKLPIIGDKFDGLAEAAGEAGNSFLDAAEGAGEAATGTDDAGDAAADASPKFDELTQAVSDTEQALNDLIDAQIAYLDSTVGAENATRRFLDDLAKVKEAQEALTEAIRDHGRKSKEAIEATKDLDEATISARDSALSAAEAQLRLADDTAKANGTTLTAAERQDVFRSSLVNLASQATGATRVAIEALILKLDEAGKDRKATLTADVTQAQERLDLFTAELQDPRVLILDADTKLAADKINRLVQDPRVLVVDAVPNRPGGMAGGTFSGGDTGMAFDVGERGREVVFIGPNQQATVIPAERSNNLFGNGSNGEVALIAALNRLASQPSARSGPVVEQLVVNEVSADPRATAFHVAARLGEEARR